MKLARTLVILAAALAAGSIAAQSVDSQSLWKQYEAKPDTHPNIANCSTAGYGGGLKAIPKPAVVANVMQCGAKGDGTTDDTAAFAKALLQASKGGAVLVPAGNYRIDGFIHLKYDGVVLRGEGRGKTTLEFGQPLAKVVQALPFQGKSGWSWSGGLIWIGPADTFDVGGKLTGQITGVGQPAWEYWRGGAKLAQVTQNASIGDKTITVDSGAKLKAGDMVLATWLNPPDASLLKHIAGHPLMEKYNWASASWISAQAYPRWQWPVRIESVTGNKVKLAQALRVDIRPEWKVEIQALGPSVHDTGVEEMSLKFHAPMSHKHLTNTGHNAVYVNRAYDCFVQSVDIQSCENGVNLAAAKNITVRGLKFTGPEQHHHTLACRVASHDNLFEDFIVDGPNRVKHGINTEWLSSGNVWRKGLMKKGTFDSHRAMSFDSIRTDITLCNDADGPGGDGAAGPFLGKRFVHWNIRIEKSPRRIPAEFIAQPECLSMGAIVGIQGAPLVTQKTPTMVAGDKGVIVADMGKVPTPADLYEAQVKLAGPKR